MPETTVIPMSNEYEIVDYKQLSNVNLFVVDLMYRNLHMHKEFELCLVLDGPLEVYTCKSLSQHRPGDLLLFNPNQPHELRSKDGSNALILSLQISPRFFSPYYQLVETLEFEYFDVSDYCTAEENAQLKNALFELSRTYFTQPQYYEFSCISLISQTFQSLLRLIPSRVMSENEKLHKRTMNKRLSRILSYADTHYTQKILLSDIARREDLSLSYLSHYFKEYLGLPFQKYIELLRFREARRLIEQTSMTLTDICITCGFSDVRYMSQIFMAQLGCTPKEYRVRWKDISRPYKEAQTAAIQRFLTPSESVDMIDRVAAGS